MANGRVFKQGNTGPSSSSISFLHSEAERLGCTIDELALACVMAQSFNPMVLSGAACVEHMRSNVGALALLRGGKLDSATVDRLFCETRMDPKEYWAERSALPWQ